MGFWVNLKRSTVSQTEGMSNPFKYTGEVYGEESGLYYLRARYYDPSIGRFIIEDTKMIQGLLAVEQG